MLHGTTFRLAWVLLTSAAGDGPAAAAPEFVANEHFSLDGASATKLQQGCWKVIEIGTWFDSGSRHATILVDSVTQDQAPGVSLALGVLYGSLEGRVNDPAMSQVTCGGSSSSETHWSVQYGHGHGKEYLGNKWGSFGPRLFNGDVVSMFADVGLQRVGFAVNGVCYGAVSFEASRVVLAAALSMKDTISLNPIAREDLPDCLFQLSTNVESAGTVSGVQLLTMSTLLPVILALVTAYS
eukprot:s811_g7.t1